MTDHSPLDLDHATMQRIGRRVADVVAEHLATLREQRVNVEGIPLETRHRLHAAPPEEGADFDALLETLRRDVLHYTGREPHPGFMGYIPSCPTFPAVMGDWLATGWNVFGGVWGIGEGPTTLELTVLDWFREWLGMPEGSSGLLTNGGSGATLTAIVAARHRVVGDDYARLPRLTLYTSDQAHSAVARAAWIAGIPRPNVRSLPTDDEFRLRPADLRAAIAADRAAGFIPMAVAVSAGTTNTGTVDPLHEIADFCAEEGIWLHADAAYGGFAVLTERGKRALAGIERCDSVALDPHKWLFMPFECGCLIVRDPQWLHDAYQVLPDYLVDVAPDEDRVNFSDRGSQLTRQSRALKVWLGVRYFGLAAIRDAIDRALDLTLHAERLVRAEPLLEVTSPASLSVLCFRVRPKGMDDPRELDTLNERVNAAANADGRWLISSTRVRGAFTLRLCIVGYRTTREDVEGVIGKIIELAKTAA